MPKILRQNAEQLYAEELEALSQTDDKPKPEGWKLSPWAVVQYIQGVTLSNGYVISTKYIGSKRLLETAVATLLTERALLLIGVPGTAKSWLSEHLAAAISGQSTLIAQGTAGMGEEHLRYGWNYARLLAEGPSEAALVPSPIMRAMRSGQIARVEELTRIPSEVQDALITILSEKMLPVPELEREVQAVKGFNIIATANDRDRGINELSSALRRRFNTVVMPLPATVQEEVDIVRLRLDSQQYSMDKQANKILQKEIVRLVTIFRELREGKTIDGKTKLKSPSSTLSSAEAIAVLNQGLSLSQHFGDGILQPEDLAASLNGAIIKDQQTDVQVWREYLETVLKERQDWTDLYRACREVLN